MCLSSGLSGRALVSRPGHLLMSNYCGSANELPCPLCNVGVLPVLPRADGRLQVQVSRAFSLKPGLPGSDSFLSVLLSASSEHEVAWQVFVPARSSLSWAGKGGPLNLPPPTWRLGNPHPCPQDLTYRCLWEQGPWRAVSSPALAEGPLLEGSGITEAVRLLQNAPGTMMVWCWERVRKQVNPRRWFLSAPLLSCFCNIIVSIAVICELTPPSCAKCFPCTAACSAGGSSYFLPFYRRGHRGTQREVTCSKPHSKWRSQDLTALPSWSKCCPEHPHDRQLCPSPAHLHSARPEDEAVYQTGCFHT